MRPFQSKSDAPKLENDAQVLFFKVFADFSVFLVPLGPGIV